MNTSGAVLLGIATLSWLLLIADLSTVVGETAMGDRDIFLGLRWLLAAVFVCAIWLCLGSLLWMAGRQGILSGWVTRVAVPLSLAAGASTLAALYLVSKTEMRLPLVCLAIPPLVALDVFALHRPSLHPWFDSPGSHLVLCGLVAALTLPAFVAFVQLRIERSGRVLSPGQFAARQARQGSRNLAKLRTMPEDANPLAWYELLQPDSGVRQEAIEAYKKLPRRQLDIERGLRNYGGLIYLIPELDLEATPDLCAGADDVLVGVSKRLETGAREGRPYEKDTDLAELFAGVRWLQAHGCSCDGGLGQIDMMARRYPDSPRLRQFLAELAQIRQDHP